MPPASAPPTGAPPPKGAVQGAFSAWHGVLPSFFVFVRSSSGCVGCGPEL
jgi:hypothetical protein